MTTATDFTPTVTVEPQPVTGLHRYVLTYEDDSTIVSGWLYDSDQEARVYAAKAIESDRQYATEVAANYDRLVSAGLIRR